MYKDGMTDSDYMEHLAESVKSRNSVLIKMGKYMAPAGAEKIVSNKSSDDGLSDVISKVTDGFGGEGKMTKDPGKAEDPDGKDDATPGDDGIDKNKRTFEKGDAKEGGDVTSKPEKETNVNSGKDSIPPKDGKSNKINMTYEEDDLFDSNESEILNKLISEIDEMEKNITNEMIDEFDDKDSVLDLDIDPKELKEVADDLELDFDDLDDIEEYSEIEY